MATTSLKRDTTIRFRAEKNLKTRLGRAALNQRKNISEFLRDELLALVSREEARPKAK